MLLLLPTLIFWYFDIFTFPLITIFAFNKVHVSSIRISALHAYVSFIMLFFCVEATSWYENIPQFIESILTKRRNLRYHITTLCTTNCRLSICPVTNSFSCWMVAFLIALWHYISYWKEIFNIGISCWENNTNGRNFWWWFSWFIMIFIIKQSTSYMQNNEIDKKSMQYIFNTLRIWSKGSCN